MAAELAITPADLTMAQWSGRVCVLVSRKTPDDDPALIEARNALTWWRCKMLFDTEVSRGTMSAERAADVLDRLAAHQATKTPEARP